MISSKQGVKLKLVSSEKYLPVQDPLKVTATLNELASDFKKEGYSVERGVLGAVILKLQDGEVHLVPSKGEISSYIFKLEDCKEDTVSQRRVIVEKERSQKHAVFSA